MILYSVCKKYYCKHLSFQWIWKMNNKQYNFCVSNNFMILDGIFCIHIHVFTLLWWSYTCKLYFYVLKFDIFVQYNLKLIMHKWNPVYILASLFKSEFVYCLFFIVKAVLLDYFCFPKIKCCAIFCICLILKCFFFKLYFCALYHKKWKFGRLFCYYSTWVCNSA